MNNEEKIKVMKNRRKKRRRRENFIIITAVFLALFVFLGGKYALGVIYQNKKQTQNKEAKTGNSKENTETNTSEKQTENSKENAEKKTSNGL